MNLLLTIHIFITLALIGVILLQRSEGGGGLVGGSNSSNAMFTARGSANLLTRITAVLAILFISNCILMTIVTSSRVQYESSILNEPLSNTPATPPSSTPTS